MPYCEPVERITIQDYQVLVLAHGDTPAGAANARGHLFEDFIALLMKEFGFDAPSRRDLNVTSEGIELDVVLRNTFTNEIAFAEGKAYATNVKAQASTGSWAWRGWISQMPMATYSPYRSLLLMETRKLAQ